MRLDQYLFSKGLESSRKRSSALIMEGLVYINGQKADKPGQTVRDGDDVEVRTEGLAYVSRGGLKLEKGLKEFNVSPNKLVCMDVGASTGGFTDCMLQNGAKKVYAVDVGYGQLAWKLREDERVIVMERCNIRNANADMFDDSVEFFTVDVSFISLKLVLPVLKNITVDGCKGICLVKPQFEAGKDKVGKNGVVRDADVHAEVLGNVVEYARQNGFSVLGLDYSPIKGPKGNIEYLMYLHKNADNALEMSDVIMNIVNTANDAL